MSTIYRIPRVLIKRFNATKRNLPRKHDSSADKPNFMRKLSKMAFNLSVYNKYGLYTHDVVNFEDPVVKEALRRQPKDVLDARNFRLIRATQADLLRIYLPKEKWITYEQDIEYRYLTLYMMEIIAERNEISEFGCLNYSDYDWPAQEVK